jgi:GTP-binding protein EngB required for normal cell division
MPQFIIIGSQSVGKSRLVESIAGERFNFVSGTLGSRRPTILEFRNVANAAVSSWSLYDPGTNQWSTLPMNRVMEIVGKAHSDLGHDVSYDPVRVRIESNRCADLTMVDLPGYRSFASSGEAQKLKDKIEDLNKSYLADVRNTILCVEEAGDAANMASLRKAADFDPNFKRTILIRNKLDKYYNDLDSKNINAWLEGMGDIPKSLTKFALTLPHWMDGTQPTKKLSELREDMDKQDLERVKSLNASSKFVDTVGWNNFAKHVEKATEKMFVDAIGPVLQKLRDLEKCMDQQELDFAQELENLDENRMLATVRTAGTSFANCLTYIMEGFIRSDINRMSLEEELREFHDYHQKIGDSECFLSLPTTEFGTLDDYLRYLREHIKVPAYDVSINGGAQFRRLMFEVECFLRFSEINVETKKRDVLQGLGVSLSSITWREVVVKLLNHDAHLPLQKRVRYVGERIKWFFMQQKDPIVQFMVSLEGSPDEKLYSVLYNRNAKMLQHNKTIRKLVFDTYDAVCQRQLLQFESLFESTLHATFANPWVFPKSSASDISFDDLEGEEVQLPTLDDTKDRILKELQSRTGIERTVTKWIYDIPIETHRLDDAVDQVQLLVLKVYSHIRSQICDQVELFAESFFKMPLMRRLEEDMMKIELSEVDLKGYRDRRTTLERDREANTYGLKEVRECSQRLNTFVMNHRSLSLSGIHD